MMACFSRIVLSIRQCRLDGQSGLIYHAKRCWDSMSIIRHGLLATILGICLGHVASAASTPTLPPAAAPVAAPREKLVTVPVQDASGQMVQLQARVCRPDANAPARLVLINHGSPPNSAARPTMQLGRCDQEAARWFLDRGYVVAFVLRRGYGATGGAWAEDYGKCSNPDYFIAGLESARDINAAVETLTSLPFVRHNGAVVVGQSAGGWGTIAYASLPHPKVVAFVVMAGGRGGHANQVPNQNCTPERLVEAAGRYGKTARTLMLWMYATNDSYFAPAIASEMYQAFTVAGGKADFQQPGPFDGDGHRLFFGAGGSSIWGPMIERYLTQQHAPAT
jgi:pimeloyl-ACP methyl ester carboxylesterase